MADTSTGFRALDTNHPLCARVVGLSRFCAVTCMCRSTSSYCRAKDRSSNDRWLDVGTQRPAPVASGSGLGSFGIGRCRRSRRSSTHSAVGMSWTRVRYRRSLDMRVSRRSRSISLRCRIASSTNAEQTRFTVRVRRPFAPARCADGRGHRDGDAEVEQRHRRRSPEREGEARDEEPRQEVVELAEWIGARGRRGHGHYQREHRDERDRADAVPPRAVQDPGGRRQQIADPGRTRAGDREPVPRVHRREECRGGGEERRRPSSGDFCRTSIASSQRIRCTAPRGVRIGPWSPVVSGKWESSRAFERGPCGAKSRRAHAAREAAPSAADGQRSSASTRSASSRAVRSSRRWRPSRTTTCASDWSSVGHMGSRSSAP
jgi:hypothetical protein